MRKIALLFLIFLFFSCETTKNIEFSPGKYTATERKTVLKDNIYNSYVLELKSDSTFNIKYIFFDYGTSHSSGIWHHNRLKNDILLVFNKEEEDTNPMAITKQDLGGYWVVNTRKVKIQKRNRIRLEIKMNEFDKSTIVLSKQSS